MDSTLNTTDTKPAPRKRKFGKILAVPTLVAGMAIAGFGVAEAASQTLTYNNVDSGQNTDEREAAVGQHRMSTADCGGPISLEVRVDVFGPDISEGFTTAVCNGGDATVFGTNDSRGDRGHFVQNHSSQRIDLTWTRQI